MIPLMNETMIFMNADPYREHEATKYRELSVAMPTDTKTLRQNADIHYSSYGCGCFLSVW